MPSALTILVVDDHPGMSHTLDDILETEGYTVHVAHSGTEAITMCQSSILISS